MTELELCKFVEKYATECHWYNKELLLWLDHGFDEFASLVKADFEHSITCEMIHGGILVFDLTEICDNHGINPLNITDEKFDFEKYVDFKKMGGNVKWK